MTVMATAADTGPAASTVALTRAEWADLRRVGIDISEREGRTLTLSQVVRRLIDFYRQATASERTT